MLILSLDTTTRDGSVAIVEDDRVVAERPGDPSRTHAERLPHEIFALLAESGMSLHAVDVFAVASGPGSFTGLRIGIATIQGLAFVGQRPVVAISALDALAEDVSRAVPAGAVVGTWIDAQRMEVFTSLYETMSRPVYDVRRLTVVEPATVDEPRVTLTRWLSLVHDRAILFAGNGAVRYADVIRGVCHDAEVLEAPLLAGTIGLMAAMRAREGLTVPPAAIRPLYVRRPDAELERERRGAEKPGLPAPPGPV